MENMAFFSIYRYPLYFLYLKSCDKEDMALSQIRCLSLKSSSNLLYFVLHLLIFDTNKNIMQLCFLWIGCIEIFISSWNLKASGRVLFSDLFVYYQRKCHVFFETGYTILAFYLPVYVQHIVVKSENFSADSLILC